MNNLFQEKSTNCINEFIALHKEEYISKRGE